MEKKEKIKTIFELIKKFSDVINLVQFLKMIYDYFS